MQWYVSYFTDNDKDKIYFQLEGLGVKKDNIHPIRLSHLIMRNRGGLNN